MPASTTSDLAAGVRAGDRTVVGRAITLVESTSPDHRVQARELLAELAPDTGGSIRVGITGVPGVGKSTFIDSLGTMLTSAGSRVGVLAVDPSSTLHGGSIMGDKTRMARLANDPAAFIRPSPSSGTLGGVTRTTRETMAVFEAAGFDVVLVETMGVGQSETAVADMVDTFVVMALSGAGDELQGIKKGVLELADIVVVNKADGDNVVRAKAAARDISTALHLVVGPDAQWQPPVLTVSALEEDGLDLFWGQVGRHRDALVDAGLFDRRREDQLVRWMWAMVDEQVLEQLHATPAVARLKDGLEADVRSGRASPVAGAERILDAFNG
ncbi:MAG: methylmalonyl Co-A mutase-associated GTPase MeaB [Acidimicrobiia bacterium]|nr:methylmalonyl Co-A mutase-associated GTPase MeaB [Acidimicrobiia bacterium]